MVVTCESCGTKFKIDPSKIQKDTVKVRCSKCRHVFTVDLRSQDIESQKKEKVIVLDDSFEEDIEKVAGKSIEPEAPLYKDHLKKQDEGLDEDLEEVSPKKGKPVPQKTQTIAVNKLLTIGIIILVIVGVILGYKYLSKPSKKPMSDTTVRAEVASVKINPQTQAFFIENVQVGQILVVQGEVTNTSNSNINFVLLEGKVIGTNGRPLLSQRFYAGNIMKKEELAQLTVDKIQERMMRREGDNLSNVRVKPGDKIPFMVVFYNLPPIDDMSDYTIEFVSAELEKPSTSQEGTTKSQSQ